MASRSLADAIFGTIASALFEERVVSAMMPVLKMKWRIAAVLLALGAAISIAAADDYPSRPIRVIVPFEPGGAPDVVTRIVAAAVQKPLGQSVIVENRAGANGIVGMQAVATA